MRTDILVAPATFQATYTSYLLHRIRRGRNCESSPSSLCFRRVADGSCACDSYASSSEIQAYFKHVAQHFGLDQYIRYNTEIVSAEWSDTSSTWKIGIAGRPSIESEILVNASGILNNPNLPDIEGYDSFKGPRLHTAAWDNSVNLRGKRVAMIGAGASAIQVLPKIEPIASHVDVYIRTPSWITPPVAAPEPDMTNHKYSAEEQERFRWNEKAYLETRKNMEAHFNGAFQMFRKGSDKQRELRRQLEERMKALIPDPDMQEKLIPKFEVGCRRVNPGEPYLAALQKSTVRPIFDPIERITPDGVMVDGELHPVDVIIAATGFNTSFRPRFPIIGRSGVNLQDQWAKTPISYMGTGVSGYPNYLIFLGPNTPIANGSVMGTLHPVCSSFSQTLADPGQGPWMRRATTLFAYCAR